MKKKPVSLVKYSKKYPVLTTLFVLSIVSLVLGQFYNIKITSRAKATNSELSTKTINLENISDEDLVAAQAYVKFKQIKSSFTPTGVPEIYGEELGISFDKVQEAINKVRVFGPTYGEEDQKITLTGNDLNRYKKIGESIACEYCCGVKTLTKEDGTAACGCAHSIMMRGLSAYLIKNYPNLSDDYILEELEKWKVTYFPKQTLSKELAVMEKSGEPGIKKILEEFPDFLPDMVGGC